jgi:hypothetical protein
LAENRRDNAIRFLNGEIYRRISRFCKNRFEQASAKPSARQGGAVYKLPMLVNPSIFSMPIALLF